METFVYNDGGRANAGYKGKTGDCVCRAIAIITGKPYQEVYDRLAEGNATQRKMKKQNGGRFGNKGQRTASRGIYTKRKWFEDYMTSMGFKWIPTMQVGKGCQVHLKAEELPKGRLMVNVSKHFTAVIDGVIHDTYDPSRDGTRCVYGYYVYQPTTELKDYQKNIISEISKKETAVVSFPVGLGKEKKKPVRKNRDKENLDNINRLLKSWRTKFKRAENAIKKLNKKKKYYEKKLT